MKLLKIFLVAIISFMLNISPILATSNNTEQSGRANRPGDDIIIDDENTTSPESGNNNGGGSGNDGDSDHHTTENGLTYDGDGNLVSAQPSNGGKWGGNSVGLGWQGEISVDDALENGNGQTSTLEGSTKSTRFLDKVVFEFEKQGGHMQQATVHIGNSLDVMEQLNPELTRKYKAVAGNQLDCAWQSNKKLTLYYAYTISINNYEDIRGFAQNPTGFSLAVYQQNLQLEVILLYFYLQYT